MLAVAVIFSCFWDGWQVPYACLALRAAGCGRILIYDDSVYSVTEPQRKAIQDAGGEIRRSPLPRSGPLSGTLTVRSLVSCYEDAFAATGASHVLKVDSDTLVLRADRWHDAVRRNVTLAGYCSPEHALFGCCQVISAAHVIRLKRAARLGPPFAGVVDWWPEDLLNHAVCGGMAETTPAGASTFLAYNFRTNPPPEHYAGIEVITFGNCMDVASGDPRKVAESKMEAFVDHFVKNRLAAAPGGTMIRT